LSILFWSAWRHKTVILFVDFASGSGVQVPGICCVIIHPWCVVRDGAEINSWLHCSYRVAFCLWVIPRCWGVSCVYVAVYGQLVTAYEGTESFESTSDLS
jgi:hypothetical protein